MRYKICPECGQLNFSMAIRCECGYYLIDVDETEGDLTEFKMPEDHND